MTRLLSLTLFFLLTIFVGTAMAGDTAKAMAGTDEAMAPTSCMTCMHRTLMCPIDGPEVMCQECKDHMASCELCKAGDFMNCPFVKDKMANGCAVCEASMMMDVPCAACARGMSTCNVCAPMMMMCETHAGEVGTCKACQAGTSLCADHQVAMFMCDDCMSRVVCAEHLTMMRDCPKCNAGEDCDDCMNAALSCANCLALHAPPMEDEVVGDGGAYEDGTM